MGSVQQAAGGCRFGLGPLLQDCFPWLTGASGLASERQRTASFPRCSSSGGLLFVLMMLMMTAIMVAL